MVVQIGSIRPGTPVVVHCTTGKSRKLKRMAVAHKCNVYHQRSGTCQRLYQCQIRSNSLSVSYISSECGPWSDEASWDVPRQLQQKSSNYAVRTSQTHSSSVAVNLLTDRCTMCVSSAGQAAFREARRSSDLTKLLPKIDVGPPNAGCAA